MNKFMLDYVDDKFMNEIINLEDHIEIVATFSKIFT